MNKQPRTIKQLNERLQAEYLEVFPFGKHAGKKVANVVKRDPNYVVWWNDTIRTTQPIDPKIVRKALDNYRHRGGSWELSGDWEDAMDYPEYTLGDPWEPTRPF